MKKIIIGALCAMCGMASFAAGESYHVYKFQFNVKTTDAKGVVSTGCCGADDTYCYREKRAVTIRGILAGCGCGAINADGSCSNAILYMWDDTHKVVIKNVEVTIPWTVQLVGKQAKLVEHFAGFKATYGANDMYEFDITLSGFGSYAHYAKDSSLSYVGSIDGNFAGVSKAASYLKKGACSTCYSEPDEMIPTTAFNLCSSCSEGLTESETKDVTPFFGAYKVKYDASVSKKVSKGGISLLKNLLPSYVGIEDYVATNIGE